MLTKNVVKDIQSLYQKKFRDEEKLFIAEGPKLSHELLQRKELICNIYATKDWLDANAIGNVPFTMVTSAELARISNLQTPNEVLIVAKQLENTSEFALEGRLTIIMDGIQDPGNVGTVIRIADWFGVKQVICTNDCADMYNPKVVQASMGSILRIKFCYKEANDINVNKVPVFGAVLNGKNMYEYSKPSEGILVIGNESKGIREPLLSAITHPITIPKIGEAESLNVAVAAGIITAWFTH